MSILVPGKKLAICSDHAGYELKNIVEGYLMSKGIEFEDYGTSSPESCDYADFAHPCDGINMTLNKHQGIRSALCWNVELAKLARQHNNANVLVLPARFIAPELALAIVDAFLETDFEGGRHQRRIEKIPVK